jgi:N-acetylneuraminic acid mutarotase
LKWEKIQGKGTVPSPRAQHSAVAIGNKIYVFGGYFFKSLTQQMEFDDLHEFDTGLYSLPFLFLLQFTI